MAAIDRSERRALGEDGSELDALVAKALIGANQQVKAMQILHDAIKIIPNSYHLFHVQADALRAHGRHDWALALAHQAVECAPSEFVTWAKLADCYVDLNMFEMALVVRLIF